MIRNLDANQEVLHILLRIFHLDIKIAVIIKHPGIEKSSSGSVRERRQFPPLLLIGKCRHTVFVQIAHIGMRSVESR